MRLLPFCIIFLLQISTFSQNLVPNPSFEDTLWCPYNAMQINAAKYWFAPDYGGGGGSSELFHVCNNNIYPPWSPGIVGVPENMQGFQYPRTGYAYAGFALMTTPWTNYREFISIWLIEPLNPIRTYYVEFWVSLSDKSSFGVANIGIHFSKDTLVPGLLGLTHLDAHMEWQGAPITDTMNWVKVSGYYRSNEDGVRIMTIGNFSDSSQTIYQQTTPTIIGGAYYYFDDFLVVDSASHANGLMERENLEGVRVFPNPANDIITLRFDNITQTKADFYLYDYTGKAVLVTTIPTGTKEYSINTERVKSGLLLYSIRAGSKTFSGKIIKL